MKPEAAPQWAWETARRFRPSLTDARWSHILGVAEVAQSLQGYSAEAQRTITCAALLHDVGYAPELQVTGMHAIDGAAYLRSLDLPPPVVSLVAYHTGAEFEAEERGLTQELASFHRPTQDLLDGLTVADLSVGPTGERVTVRERLGEILERYPAEHVVHRAVSRSRRHLEACSSRVRLN